MSEEELKVVKTIARETVEDLRDYSYVDVQVPISILDLKMTRKGLDSILDSLEEKGMANIEADLFDKTVSLTPECFDVLKDL